ncbi:MAG: HTTM domain-containing protein [Planctomycetota bacterium]
MGKWKGLRAIYVQIRGDDVHWENLPEFVVQFQEIYGERILFNPSFGQRDQPLSFKEAEHRILSHWQRVYGRFPKIHSLVPLEACFKIIDRKMGSSPADREFRGELTALRERLQTLFRSGWNSEQYSRRMQSIREKFVALSSDPQRGHWVRLAFGQAVPFPLESGDKTSPCLMIEDPKLLTPIGRHGGRYVGLACPEWKGEEKGEIPAIYGDYDQLTIREWSAFERCFFRRVGEQGIEIVWNQQADLCDWQNLSMPARPYMCHQYAVRVANLWERETGRRPKVFMRTQVRLLPYDFQPLVDPMVNLAESPLNLWGNSPWIVPLNKVVPGEATLAPSAESNRPTPD